MKKLLRNLIKVLSISLCVTAIVIPQALQQYTKTIVNGKEKWILHKQYLSNFDEEESQQQFDPKSLFHQKENSSPNILFDDRWTLQLPYPTDGILLAAAADDNFLISAGVYLLSFTSAYSDLIISTDNGENWNIQKFENSLLVTMDKYENFIWMGGYDLDYNGFILKSTDLGENWNEILSIDSFAVLYVKFFDANNGVVVSENILSGSDILKIYHTTDGGDSWTSNSSSWPGYIQGPYSSHFSNHNDGWICILDHSTNDISRIMNTTNGGLNWEIQFTDTLEELEIIHFSDSNHGWAGGVKKDYSNFSSELRIYSTVNGGNNWSQHFSLQREDGTTIGYNIYALDSLNCWLAVSTWPYFNIYRTTNGGIEWNEISQLQFIDFQRGEIEFISETEGWIVSPLGKIHYTSDGGYTWSPKYKSVTAENLYSLDLIDENIGWAASKGGSRNVIIKTNNGGTDWDIVFSDSNSNFIDMDFVSDQTGFTISENFLINNYTINKTEDGGVSWYSTQFGNAELNSILFTDFDNGWSVGSQNNQLFITHTSNTGVSWEQQPNINISGWSLNDVDFVNSEYGFAVGIFGVLIKTTNGGNSWTESWGNIDPNLFWIHYELTGVYFPEASNCWVVGSSSYFGGPRTMVAHTTDGGANWDTLSFPSGYGSGEIFFINQLDGFIVGRIYDYKTTDGGVTWSRIDYPSDILKMFFLNEGLGWAVGYSGRIFKYYDPNVGINDGTHLELPNNFALMQNYPNPFNPNTRISWQTPLGSWQTLKIYDVLGNKVTTLVDEYKPAGTYEVEWNAAGLPSGVYFFQLQTNDFTETKKMILIK